jgi:hypothetical protein
MSEKISLVLAVFLLNVHLAAADSPPPAANAPATSGILLLRNGQVIEGHIERNGDYYTITAPGQEMNVHTSGVEFLCRDLRDGYQRKKAAIQPTDAQQHLQLLLWCERHGLLDCARQELDAVEAIDRNHPMIAVLRRRLKIESQPASEPVRTAEKIQPPPSDDQLKQMTRGMPPGTVELFVQVVQPILLNHYPGARGYALPDNKRLQLMRPPLGETPGQRITLRNLHSVLQCIDWNNPGDSPMLKATSGLSAGAASEFPVRNSTQYWKLAQWVYLVAQKPMPAEEGGGDNASYTDLAGEEAQTAHNRPAPHIPYMPASVGRKEIKEKPAAETDAPAAAIADVHAKPKTAKEPDDAHTPRRIPADRAAAQAIDSIDPYDPATFNNQGGAPNEMPTPAERALNAK